MAKINKKKQRRTGGKTGKEKMMKQTEQQQDQQKQHLKSLILKKMKQARKEKARTIRENTANRTVMASKQLSKEKRNETIKSKNTMRKTTKLKN